MTEQLDEPEPPRRVQVPTSRDLYGRPVDFIECDATRSDTGTTRAGARVHRL